MPQDSTVYTGKIWTGTADDHWVEAFAVQDGKVLTTGTREEILAQVGNKVQTINLD